jgi:hypothetical protein
MAAWAHHVFGLGDYAKFRKTSPVLNKLVTDSIHSNQYLVGCRR